MILAATLEPAAQVMELSAQRASAALARASSRHMAQAAEVPAESVTLKSIAVENHQSAR